ncbi:hypothetical protein TcBrA4_0094330 [Trypanosoma cruzi]|nr:hypothetical protein TcBrA4_0094330 [Trypanosoma cruzi]
MTYFNGDTYTGEWHHGDKHGVGTYTSASLQYEGGWYFGSIRGRGQCKYADGSTYEGEWLNGMYHGKGQFISPTNRRVILVISVMANVLDTACTAPMKRCTLEVG